MDLSKISVQVRPRNPYEAIDLGFVMARQWYLPLILLWLLPALPVMAVSYVVFMQQPLWALLLVWWLKPLLEAIQLRFISEKLFDDSVHWRQTLRDARHIALHQWFAKLVTQRLAFARSFNMPVGELEQLTGKRRQQRLDTLHRGAGSSGLWLTFAGHSIETILVFAVFSTAWMFIPMEMDIDFELDMLFSSPLLFPTITIAGFIAMTLAAPFYVCAGFMLYINRRTWLEAWDIELTFRQLSNDYAKPIKTMGMLALLLSISGLLTLPQPAQAELSREESQQRIIEILEADAFHEIKEEERWRWIDKPEPEEVEDGNWLTRFGEWIVDKLKGLDGIGDAGSVVDPIISGLEILLWAVVIAIIAYLIYRFRGVRAPELKLGKGSRAPPPSHLFGLELNQDSLPEDIIAAAQSLWQQQQFRQALSLLYRAALTYLVHERHLPLNSSHTEQECLRLCLLHEPTQRGQVFQSLTQHWIKLAYAHQPLTDQEFLSLCESWHRFEQQEPVA